MHPPIDFRRLSSGSCTTRHVGLPAMGPKVVHCIGKSAPERRRTVLRERVYADLHGSGRNRWHACRGHDGRMDRTPSYVRAIVRRLVHFACVYVSGERHIRTKLPGVRVCGRRYHGRILRLVSALFSRAISHQHPGNQPRVRVQFRTCTLRNWFAANGNVDRVLLAQHCTRASRDRRIRKGWRNSRHDLLNRRGNYLARPRDQGQAVTRAVE